MMLNSHARALNIAREKIMGAQLKLLERRKLEAELESVNKRIEEGYAVLRKYVLEQQQMKVTAEEPFLQSEESKKMKERSTKQLCNLSALLKSNKTDNRNIKREYQRSIEVLRQTVQMNNEEEQNIRKYINRSKEVERELAFVESQISLTHESIKKNNREDVGITKSVEQIDRSVASMMNNQ